MNGGWTETTQYATSKQLIIPVCLWDNVQTEKLNRNMVKSRRLNYTQTQTEGDTRVLCIYPKWIAFGRSSLSLFISKLRNHDGKNDSVISTDWHACTINRLLRYFFFFLSTSQITGITVVPLRFQGQQPTAALTCLLAVRGALWSVCYGGFIKAESLAN